jgi:hypothetical protein
VQGSLDRNVERFAFESQLRGIGACQEGAGLYGVPVGLDFVNPVGISRADIPYGEYLRNRVGILKNAKTIELVLEGCASVPGAKTKGNFAKDLPEETIPLALDIEIFEWNRSLFFSIVLRICFWCSQAYEGKGDND